MTLKVRTILAGGLAFVLLGFAATSGRKVRFSSFPAQTGRLGTAAPAQPAPAPPGQPNPTPPGQPNPTPAGQPNPTPALPASTPVPAQAAQVLDASVRIRLRVILTKGLSTDHNLIGDPWTGTLAQEVRIKGQRAWPKGTPVEGILVQCAPGALLEGGGGLELRIRSVGGAELEAGSYVVDGRDLKAGTAEKVVRIPTGSLLEFSMEAPKAAKPESVTIP